jgi:hypothetical protein
MEGAFCLGSLLPGNLVQLVVGECCRDSKGEVKVQGPNRVRARVISEE